MKIIIDILLFITMLLEFSRGYMKPIYHEILGIILLVLVIIHLYLNRNYIKNIFKGKYNYSRYVMLIINIGFFITFILSIIFGILSSQDILTFLNIGNIKIINLHKVFAYLSLILMGIHVGINFNAMFGKLEKKSNRYILFVIRLVFIIYGIYSFIKLDIIKHIIGTYGFSLVDGNIIINLLRYLSMVLMLIIIVNYLDKFIKRK